MLLVGVEFVLFILRLLVKVLIFVLLLIIELVKVVDIVKEMFIEVDCLGVRFVMVLLKIVVELFCV